MYECDVMRRHGNVVDETSLIQAVFPDDDDRDAMIVTRLSKLFLLLRTQVGCQSPRKILMQ